MPVDPGATIGAGTVIDDENLVHIEDAAVIGTNCYIDVFVSIHSNCTIGNNVYINCHSTIVSGISIGDNSIIMHGAKIYKNVPAGVQTDGKSQTTII